ncbi:MAG: ribokinase [Lachnospiraceae bacterium]|nr:ribokinase [Lachnospiraceae bacterium]
MKKAPKILIVGSLVMDTIMSTEVFPEPGATVLGDTFRTAPGGKGANQAVQTARLGADVTMVGKLGDDAFGSVLRNALISDGIHTEHLMEKKGASSAAASIILTTKDGVALNNRIIVASGTNMMITPEDVAFLKEEIAQYDMVILQLEIPMQINEIVAAYAFDKGVPVMLNPAPIAPLSDELLSHITYLSPNETEAASLLGMVVRREGEGIPHDKVPRIREVMQKRGIRNLLLTLGDAGAMMITQDDVILEESVKGIHAVDPTAAGDSFVGAFCTGKCLGMSDAEAIRLANIIGAITVSGMGAQPSLATFDKVRAFVKEHGIDDAILRYFED